MAQESHITRSPANQNYMELTRFQFAVPNMPFSNYWCQSVMLPGVSTSEVMQPTPFTDLWRHGDKLVYEPITLTFYVDEDLRQWEETYNWLKALTFPHEFEEYGLNSRHDLYRDCMLTILTNSNIPNIRIKFHDCHPISLGLVQFDTQNDADVIPIADVTFRYDTFEIDRL